MTEVSDPGNVSALSSEVEALIEEAVKSLLGVRYVEHTGCRGQDWCTATVSEKLLRDLVRKALGTEFAQKYRRTPESFYYEGVARGREQARALAEALKALRIDANRLCDRNLGGSYEADCRRSIAGADAALDRWRAERSTREPVPQPAEQAETRNEFYPRPDCRCSACHEARSR